MFNTMILCSKLVILRKKQQHISQCHQSLHLQDKKTRTMLIDVARMLFAKWGKANTTMNDIAKCLEQRQAHVVHLL